MGFGFIAMSDTGSIAANSDHPNFAFQGVFDTASRSGNVNIYNITSPKYPVIFMSLGVGNAGSVLSVIPTGANTWQVTCICNGYAKIYVFCQINGLPSGFGLAAWNIDGVLCFDSSQSPLNAEKVSVLGSGGSIGAAGDLASFTGGHVYPQSSYSDADVAVASYSYTDYKWVNTYVCEPEYVCRFVTTGGWQYVCSDTNVCSNQWVTTQSYVCAYENVCSLKLVSTPFFVTTNVYAKVRTTNWTIHRGAAVRSSEGYYFDWVLHDSGYYKQVLSTYWNDIATPVNPNSGVPIGYNVPGSFYATTESVSGPFTKNNTFPYSSTTYNMINSTIITARSSDYA